MTDAQANADAVVALIERVELLERNMLTAAEDAGDLHGRVRAIETRHGYDWAQARTIAVRLAARVGHVVRALPGQPHDALLAAEHAQEMADRLLETMGVTE